VGTRVLTGFSEPNKPLIPLFSGDGGLFALPGRMNNSFATLLSILTFSMLFGCGPGDETTLTISAPEEQSAADQAVCSFPISSSLDFGPAGACRAGRIAKNQDNPTAIGPTVDLQSSFKPTPKRYTVPPQWFDTIDAACKSLLTSGSCGSMSGVPCTFTDTFVSASLGREVNGRFGGVNTVVNCKIVRQLYLGSTPYKRNDDLYAGREPFVKVKTCSDWEMKTVKVVGDRPGSAVATVNTRESSGTNWVFRPVLANFRASDDLPCPQDRVVTCSNRYFNANGIAQYRIFSISTASTQSPTIYLPKAEGNSWTFTCYASDMASNYKTVPLVVTGG
jgi:hypothetical protein